MQRDFNENVKQLYRLDKRSLFLVLIDLAGFGFLSLIIISSVAAYLTGFFLAFGFAVSLLFIMPIFEIILFNYIIFLFFSKILIYPYKWTLYI